MRYSTSTGGGWPCPWPDTPSLRPLLESQVTEERGRLYVGDRMGGHCTLWWRTDQ